MPESKKLADRLIALLIIVVLFFAWLGAWSFSIFWEMFWNGSFNENIERVGVRTGKVLIFTGIVVGVSVWIWAWFRKRRGNQTQPEPNVTDDMEELPEPGQSDSRTREDIEHAIKHEQELIQSIEARLEQMSYELLMKKRAEFRKKYPEYKKLDNKFPNWGRKYTRDNKHWKRELSPIQNKKLDSRPINEIQLALK